MRRSGRHVFTLCSAGSLVLWLATAALWAGSYVWPGIVAVSWPFNEVRGLGGERVPARTVLFLASDRGHLGWWWERDVPPPGTRLWGVSHQRLNQQDPAFWEGTGGFILEGSTLDSQVSCRTG